MNTAKVIFAHVFRCNIVRDVLKKITPFVMLTSISHSLCLVPVLSVVCWRAHVLFTLFVCVCVCIVVSKIHCVVFLLSFFSSCVP
jgi:hypothetical protein